jgi:hypothetical protein
VPRPPESTIRWEPDHDKQLPSVPGSDIKNKSWILPPCVLNPEMQRFTPRTEPQGGLKHRFFMLRLFNQTWIEPEVLDRADRQLGKIRVRRIDEEVALIGNNHAWNAQDWRSF